jgi:heptaprenyl diphosphate synthase
MIGAAGKPNMPREADIREGIGDEALYRGLRAALAATEKELLRICGAAGAERMRGDLGRIVGAGGKRLRPALAYLCRRADAARGEALRALPLLCMLERMHSGSLRHDDVVDDAAKRRGVASVNASSGVRTAVQSGDFLLAKAMEKLDCYRGTGINEMLAAVSAEMCRGELLQQRVRYDADAQSEAF